MSRSLKRRSLVALAVVAAGAVAAPLALAGAASIRCGSRGADPRTCTLAPGEAPPTIGAVDGARLAAAGSIAIPVRVSGPGTIRAIGEAAAGDETVTAYGPAPDGSKHAITVPKRFMRVIEPATATATHAGTVELTATLTDAARAKLAAGQQLVMDMEIKASNSPVSFVTVVPLATP